jgi:hypothetical protein
MAFKSEGKGGVSPMVNRLLRKHRKAQKHEENRKLESQALLKDDVMLGRSSCERYR